MSKRSNNTLSRTTGGRKYRSIYWVGTEGQTEKDYLNMDVFKSSSYTIKFPQEVRRSTHNPTAVLKRIKKEISSRTFRKSDEAWVVVDVDNWDQSEFKTLFAWEQEDPRYHVAISNPKFELFLVMHFNRGIGCTTPQQVDASLKQQWGDYKKRINSNHFTLNEIKQAIKNAKDKRRSCKDPIPDCGMTDIYLLIDQLIKRQ